MSEIKLKPCLFCGAEKDLQILNTGDLVGWTCHYDCDKQIDTISKLNNQWFVKLLLVRESAVDVFQAGYEYGVNLAWVKINKIPAADVAPVVHGRWAGTVCTACGESTSFYYDCNYCPWCGAKMDEEEHNG